MTGVTLQDSPQKRNSLPMLMLVVGLMAMPVIIAAGLYFIGWQPERTGNQGHLVSPPLPLPVSGLKTTDGSPLATAELHDKWLLLLSGSGQCVANCIQRLDEMRRIQVSLRRDMGRLRRVVLTDRNNASFVGNNSTKFLTVEELVKEITSIPPVRSCSMRRSVAIAGLTVRYTGTTSTSAPWARS